MKKPNARPKKRGIARAIACGMLLALPACHIPALREADGGPILPVDYKGTLNEENNPQVEFDEVSNQGENSSQLRVEEFYNDPVLTTLIHQGLAENRELKILEQEVEVASNDVLARQGAYLPFATIGAGGSVDKPSLYTRDGAIDSQLSILPGTLIPDPLWNSVGRINVFWEIDIWRKLRNARDAAGQRYIAAAEKRNFFVTKLVAEIAENYYRLMALDKRIENLNRTIELQEQSLQMAQAKKDAGRGTELGVLRFEAEVKRNQSEKLIVKQTIIEVENRINFLINRYPRTVERDSSKFFDLTLHALSVGLPSQLIQNRPDIRQAEGELAAAGLDVFVARADFYPRLSLNAAVGTEAFNPKYLFTPESIAAAAAGDLVGPLLNKKAIRAAYLSANAKQLESIYNYQRTILNAFTEVINRVSMAENYRKSIDLKKKQLEALEGSVDNATKLFQNARAEYIDVLFAQRDLMDARMDLIDTKREQLSAVVNAYQALGGGDLVPISPAETAAITLLERLKMLGPSSHSLSNSAPRSVPRPNPLANDPLPEKAIPGELPAPKVNPGNAAPGNAAPGNPAPGNAPPGNPPAQNAPPKPVTGGGDI